MGPIDQEKTDEFSMDSAMLGYRVPVSMMPGGERFLLTILPRHSRLCDPPMWVSEDMQPLGESDLWRQTL